MKKASMTESAIESKVWKLATVMSTAGVASMDYIRQLTYILFLKMDLENSDLYMIDSQLPEDCRWNKLLEVIMKGEELVNRYNYILTTLSKQDGLVGSIFVRAKNEINKPSHLKKIIEFVNEENWLSNSDIKGVIYESILAKTGQADSKSSAGQYFTPRPLVQAIVDCVAPKATERVCDPACGTGGFLLAACDYVESHESNIKKKAQFKREFLTGNDISPLLVTLASMNMYLHDIGIGSVPIQCKDSLEKEPEKLVDVVLANPPFGTRAQEAGAVREMLVETSDNQLNFLQHFMLSLKNNGRAGVVIPDSVLFAGEKGSAAQILREKLLKDFNLHTILRLPKGIFYANGISASVLFFEKGSPTKNIWFYDYRTGIKKTLKKNPLKRDDLADFVSCYCPDHLENRKETWSEDNPNGRWRKFPVETFLSDNRIYMDISWITKKDELEGVTLTDLLGELSSKSEEISKAVGELSTLLKDTE